MSLDQLKGVKAFIVLYEPDLSSHPLGVVLVNDEVINEMKKSWLAVAMYGSGNECKALVVYRGEVADSKTIEPRLVYTDLHAVLRRDLEKVEEVCRQ